MNDEARKDDKEQRYFVVCKLCGREFKSINWRHLRFIHGFGGRSRHPMLLYKKTFQVAHSWSYRTRVLQRRSLFKALRLVGRRRTKAWVIEEIRRRARQGEKIDYTAVMKTENVLAVSGERKFGSWSAALLAAGFDPGRIRKNRAWNKKKIIEVVRRRHRQEMPMNSQAIMRADNGLYLAGRLRFGGWDAVLRAAGLDPDRFRKLREWDNEQVIDGIRRRVSAGLDMRYSAVHASDPSLLRSAERRFGGWYNALKTAGIDPNQYRILKAWDKIKIVERIRQRANQGFDMTYAGVKSSDPTLLLAAGRRFGGWYQALKTSGLDPDRYKQRNTWDKRKIIESIRRRARRGLEMNASAVEASNSALYHVAGGRFGKWSMALKAAGIDPNRHRKVKAWDSRGVIEGIRRRVERGLDMTYTGMRSSDHALLRAAERRFGGWYNAIKTAGLDPDRYKQHDTWDKRKVIESIRHRSRRGLDMSASAILTSSHALYKAAYRQFGGWSIALKAAGIDPDRYRKYTIWTDASILATIRDVHRNREKTTLSILGSSIEHAIYRRGWTLAQARAMAGVPDKTPTRN